MTTERWKPKIGEAYFIVSDYSPEPYGYIWQGNKMNLNHAMHKTLYRTKEEALAAKQKSV